MQPCVQHVGVSLLRASPHTIVPHAPIPPHPPQVGVWRDGAALELPVRVSTPRQLVPLHSHDVRPRYFIYAGLVFTRLTVGSRATPIGSRGTSCGGRDGAGRGRCMCVLL